jgi:hypothetical protein
MTVRGSGSPAHAGSRRCPEWAPLRRFRLLLWTMSIAALRHDRDPAALSL